jgi:hypothetical protein
MHPLCSPGRSWGHSDRQTSRLQTRPPVETPMSRSIACPLFASATIKAHSWHARSCRCPRADRGTTARGVQHRRLVSTSPPAEDAALALQAPRTRRLPLDQPAWLRVPPRPHGHHRRHPRRADPDPRLPRHRLGHRPTTGVATQPRHPAPSTTRAVPSSGRSAILGRWRAIANGTDSSAI